MAIETSAGAVVFYRGTQIEYLLLLSTFWGFPKGHIEPGEHEVQAALREIREEASLDVNLIDGFRHIEEYTYDRKGQALPKRVIYFLGEATGRNSQLSHEHSQMVWLPYHEAMTRLEFEGLRNTLRDANEYLTRTA
jgi:8-oxo-dGTP pyrophosphatase MutT (NUDIX family)